MKRNATNMDEVIVIEYDITKGCDNSENFQTENEGNELVRRINWNGASARESVFQPWGKGK